MGRDDAHLERLIGAAFDRLRDPVPARLKAVEDRLIRQPKQAEPAPVRFRYWWFIAVLAATGAAAWWIGSYDNDAREEDPRSAIESQVAPGSGRSDRPAVKPTPPEPTQGIGAKDKRPLIYQRETH